MLSENEKLFYIPIYTIVMISKLFTIYGVLFQNWMRNKKYTRMTVSILLFSLFHAITAIVQHLSQNDREGHFWREWFLSSFGILTMDVYMFALLELLYLFSPIAPYWNQHKVSQYQFGLLPVLVILSLPSVIFPIKRVLEGTLLTIFESVLFINKWYLYGTTATAGTLSILTLFVMVYLTLKLYKHFNSNAKNQIDIKKPAILRFLLLYCTIIILDWIAIYMFLQQSKIFEVLAMEIFHLRVIVLVFIFMQLRNITFTKKQLEKVQVDQLLRKGSSAPTGPVQMEPKTMQVVSTMPTEHMVSTIPI